MIKLSHYGSQQVSDRVNSVSGTVFFCFVIWKTIGSDGAGLTLSVMYCVSYCVFQGWLFKIKLSLI